MKLYGERNPAPNPRKVRIFLAEKELEIPWTRVALMKGEHKAPDFMKKNSLGQVPVLELDDGTYISESLAICRYIEELHPLPALFGAIAIERALTEMWVRRVEAVLWRPLSIVWRHADERTAFLGNQFKDFGEFNKAVTLDAMRWHDAEMGDGRHFIAGAGYSMADIVLLCGIDFAKFVGMEMPAECSKLRAWHDRVSMRPSAAA